MVVLLVFPAILTTATGLARSPGSACRVLHVVDGDTVGMWCTGIGYRRGRLLGFDTPEVQGECARERWLAFRATLYLRWKLWTAGQVEATPAGTDRYGRVLTQLLLDGRSVAEPMVNAGLARRYGGGERMGWCSKAADYPSWSEQWAPR